MSAASHNAVACEMEYQIANAQTGRNMCTSVSKRTTIIKRRSGLELVSDDPPLRKALKLQQHKYEVYSSHLAQGKLTFILRDSGSIYQYNLRNGEPAAMAGIFAFAVRTGAVSKTPLARQPAVAAIQQQQARSCASLPASSVLGKRSAAFAATAERVRGYDSPSRPLRRRTSDYESPSIDPTRRRAAASALGAALASPEPLTHRSRAVRRPLLQGTSASVSKPSAARPSLTDEQARVLRIVRARQCVFFTGSAGTGKSFLLQQVLATVRAARRRVYATATTGIAAHNIGGMTLHHFAGLDTRSSASASDLVRQIQQKRDALVRWRDVDVLVIDEVSMLDGQLFDALEEAARALRRSSQFFGGIQLVLSGDFFQLPPVTRGDRGASATLCFESAAWRRGIRETVVLERVFRQTNGAFVAILNAFRVGRPTDAMVATLNARYTPSASLDWSAIHIFTHNKDVLETNTKRLEELHGKKFNFVSADSGKKEFLSACPAPPTLSLKQDAHVMLIKTINASTGLVNGLRGVVEGFTPQTNLPIVRFANGAKEIVQHEDFPVHVGESVQASRRQLPLALAWAISIHKSQGLAFDSAVLDLSRVFEFGQAYVALSRVRSLEGLRLRSRLRVGSVVLADAKVLAFYERLENECARASESDSDGEDDDSDADATWRATRRRIES